MKENIFIILPVLFPFLAGIVLMTGICRSLKRNTMLAIVWSVLFVEVLLVFLVAATGGSFTLAHLNDTMVLSFGIDGLSRLFSVLTVCVWFLVGIYSGGYMAHQKEERRFFGYYLIVVGVLIGVEYAGNLITLYAFFELMTLSALPLILHDRTKEAVAAGLKYLYYSVAGAFSALFGIFFLASLCEGPLSFVPGGFVTAQMIEGKESLFLLAVCFIVLGFGTKAGIFPMHGWLPTAHPVAPAPASAVLSGLITKSGVLALIRSVFYCTGVEMIRGTWVQTMWSLLALLTVFMGSLLAYREDNLKKRLAYSSVSQLSYILFGLSMLHPLAFMGALAHVVFHCLIKVNLFLSAGAAIVMAGWKKTSQMRGLGLVMPVTLIAFTSSSLALIGIPPFSGFISKFYLATGALDSGCGIYTWAGPVVLLISALLTAGYLLPVTIHGFMPGADFDAEELKAQKLFKKEPPKCMVIPMVILGAAALLLGVIPGPLLGFLESIAATVL